MRVQVVAVGHQWLRNGPVTDCQVAVVARNEVHRRGMRLLGCTVPGRRVGETPRRSNWGADVLPGVGFLLRRHVKASTYQRSSRWAVVTVWVPRSTGCPGRMTDRSTRYTPSDSAVIFWQ